MHLDLRPTSHRDAAALSDFLAHALRVGSGTSLLDREHMEWKYWTARPDWNGSRSVIAEHRGAIVAHVAAWPVRVRLSGQEVSAVHGIDWAADPKYPGVGIKLLRHIAQKVRLMIATGGSESARGIFPVIGFFRHGEAYRFALPVRPLRQALTTEKKDWKLPARFLRSSCWRLSHPLSSPPGWSARPVTPEAVPLRLWPRPSFGTAVTARGAAFYRYFVDSPSAPHVLFGLWKNSELVGYFCLFYARHVARVVDFWLPSGNVADWCAGYRTAAALAAREERVYEVSAGASTALCREALLHAGFRMCGRSEVSLLGDAKILEGQELHLQMVDSDASFLSGEVVSYYT